jgi:S-adenosylmethionine/arginine decarboxylase-like enzyme
MPEGRHVKVLARGLASRLGSAATVETTLRELVELLGMRLLGAPHLYEVETEIAKLGVEPFEDEGGVTGICVLSTSHCSIHTWPLRSFFVMDVYLATSLGAYDVQVTDVSFALEYKFARVASPSRSTPKLSGREEELRG